MPISTNAEHDSIAPCAVRLRHPLDCLPYRPERSPAWSPSRQRQIRDHTSSAWEAPERQNPRIVAAPGLGAVRINFCYAAFQSMTAAHSEKAGRDQYFEGPHETYGFRLHEIDPSIVDLQYQPIRIEWRSLGGRIQSMTLDFAIETQDGEIVFGEDKASTDYFDDSELSERLDFAQKFLEAKGASLQRRVAGGLPTRRLRRIVKDIFDDRRTDFEADQVKMVRNLVELRGGVARLDEVVETIGGHRREALAVARAMMHRRHISMPLSAPPMPDVPVTVPPVAAKGRLRAFLNDHVAAEGAPR